MISPAKGNISICSSLLNILKSLILLIACCTYIPTLAIFEVLATSSFVICKFVCFEGGMHKVH